MNKHKLPIAFLIILMAFQCLAATSGGSSSRLTIQEEDGSPQIKGIKTLVVTNGSLTDDGGRQGTLDISGATVEDAVYDATWNGDADGTSKNSIYDYLIQFDTDADGDFTDEVWWAAAGGGDVTSVGDATEGATLDGTSDGGTWIKFYDAQGAGQLITGDLTEARTWTLPDNTGTVLTSASALDGELISNDTIDDDSIDFADVTGADLTLTDCGAITTTGANDITAGGDMIVTGSDLTIGTAGVKLTGDGDGAVTILGLGDGFDESLTLNFDDTENKVVVSTATGVTTVDFGAIVVDADITGNVTGNVSGSSGSCTGNSVTASTATEVTVTDNENTAENDLILFAADAEGGTNPCGIESDGDFHYNPSTGTVTATAFAGNLTGNVTGDVSGNAGTVTNGVYTTDAGTVFLAPDGDGASLSNVLHSSDMAKDIVAGTGITGAANDVLYGADSDLTLAVDTTELDGALTWGAADGASITWTWNLVANDPSITFGPANITANQPFYLGYGSNAAGELRILEDTDDGSNYASFSVPALAGNTVYTLPPDDGEAGEQLQTNGSGVLTWEAAGAAGGESLAATLAIGADANDTAITSLAKLEGVDNAVYVDLGNDTYANIAADAYVDLSTPDVKVQDNLQLDSDGAIIELGADQDVTITHVADTGILLAIDRQIQFNDSGTFIESDDDGYIDIDADTGIRLNSTAITISEGALTDSTVVSADIKDSTIDSDDYADGSIDHEHLSADVISGLADTTSADADYFLFWDATDSALKKCDGAEVRGGGAGGASTKFLSAASAILDDSSPPALTIAESTGTGTPRRRVANFDPDTDEIIYWTFAWDAAYATATVFWYSNDTGANEDCIWACSISATTEADADDMLEDAADSSNTESEDVDTNEATRLMSTVITLSNTDSAASGDIVTMRFWRDANDSEGDADADALTSDATLIGVLLQTS